MPATVRRPRSAYLRGLAGGPRYAQAYIHTFNLPDTVPELLAWVGDDPWTAGTPLDQVINADPGEPFTWTAPAGVGRGDVVFLRYAAKVRGRIGSLRKAAQKAGALSPGLADFLRHAQEQADRYAGCVVAVGELDGSGVPRAAEPGEVAPHWASRLEAPVVNLHVLATPLQLRDHEAVLPRPHKAITELSATEFAALIECLRVSWPLLPHALLNVRPGRADFADFSRTAWRDVACRVDQRFTTEKELYEYLAEPLLGEVADPGTRAYAQARCVPIARAGARPRRGELPIADYVVRLGGRWTPVEVKRRLENWPGLLDQVAQYVGVSAYEVRTPDGSHQRLPASAEGDACLLVDQEGVYLTRGGIYRASAVGRPLWARPALAKLSAAALRRRLLPLLA